MFVGIDGCTYVCTRMLNVIHVCIHMPYMHIQCIHESTCSLMGREVLNFTLSSFLYIF